MANCHVGTGVALPGQQAAQPDIDPADVAGSAPELADSGSTESSSAVELPTVLKKLHKWGAYAAYGGPLTPYVRMIPCKTPLSEEILRHWSLPEAPQHRLTVASLLNEQQQHGRRVGMILDLSNHDCLYHADLPADLHYEHIKLVAKELPPPDFVSQVIAAADQFLAAHPQDFIAIHCAYGFNRTGFTVCCYLIERCGLSVDQALSVFRESRPPGVKHEQFIAELHARYSGNRVASPLGALDLGTAGSGGANAGVGAVATPETLTRAGSSTGLGRAGTGVTENDSLGANERAIMSGFRSQQRQAGVGTVVPSQLEDRLEAVAGSPITGSPPHAPIVPSGASPGVFSRRSLGDIMWESGDATGLPGVASQPPSGRSSFPDPAGAAAARSARMYGCLMGALVGDAAGAPLEFSEVTYAAVRAALTFPGGGCWEVGPGQVTDDGELTLCLARALNRAPYSDRFPAEAVAQEYEGWLASEPFDVGNTCRVAFRGGGGAAAMRSRAAQGSAGSQANGAMMRAAPLPLWLVDATEDSVVTCARADAALSHPHPACQDANAAYCLALWHTVRTGDSHAAVARATAWAQREACAEVVTWITHDSRDLSGLDPGHQIGFVKHAFCLAMHCLRERLSFIDGLLITLLMGGDTDTNAAIVGAALGAMHGVGGVRGVPEPAVAKVRAYSYQATGLGQPRPPSVTPGPALNALAERWPWIPHM